jgi:hypothetical protein
MLAESFTPDTMNISTTGYSYITIHGINTKHGMRVHLNYLTDSLATAWDKVEELHPEVQVTGHTLHLAS